MTQKIPVPIPALMAIEPARLPLDVNPRHLPLISTPPPMHDPRPTFLVSAYQAIALIAATISPSMMKATTRRPTTCVGFCIPVSCARPLACWRGGYASGGNDACHGVRHARRGRRKARLPAELLLQQVVARARGAGHRRDRVASRRDAREAGRDA